MEATQQHYNIDRVSGSSLWVCQCGWEKCESEHCFGPAVRDHFLIHFIASGSGRYFCRTGEYRLTAGQGFLIAPGEVTTYTADKAEPWEYYWVGFKGVDAAQILSRCSLSVQTPTFAVENEAETLRLFQSLLEAFKQSKGREYAMLGHLYLFLSELSGQGGMQAAPGSNASLYLNSAVDYINDNYSYDISVSGLAAYIGIDRTYLYRIFMENLSISPERYLLKVRMTRAAELLKTTGGSVLQIALSAGYKDISHFSGSFKKYFGVSPKEYRINAN